LPPPYSGRCACGSVAATIHSEPLAVRQCWCRQCQQIAAGGATTNAMFLSADIEMTGELATHSFIAASGNTLTQSFCGKCGTPIMGQSSGRTHLASIRFGFLDETHGLAPSAAIWLGDAPEWATIDPHLERFAGQAPPPAGKG
jgi:hypothetical protein